MTEAPADAEGTVAELLRATPTMRVRYLVLGPLEELLARAGDGGGRREGLDRGACP